MLLIALLLIMFVKKSLTNRKKIQLGHFITFQAPQMFNHGTGSDKKEQYILRDIFCEEIVSRKDEVLSNIGFTNKSRNVGQKFFSNKTVNGVAAIEGLQLKIESVEVLRLLLCLTKILRSKFSEGLRSIEEIGYSPMI
uniref:Uncharacterized protein n=1 Tax=Rhizophagus irregularis (strain DAOM 181602 / DAOM 197198 / MUCL 43194) TaxID=747089 RepID=U9T0A3_RHIID